MNFYALRVSLVAEDPQLFVNQSMSDDIILFEDALKHATHTPPKNEHDEKLFSIKIVAQHNEGYIAGMVARAKSLSGHDAEFKQYHLDDFPPMIWFWDREQQVILIEKKSSAFATATIACKAFQIIANNIELANYGIRADIEPVLEQLQYNFWSEYDKFEHVQLVSFELTPPNLFGNTIKEMQKALNNTTKETNANKITTIFENKEGKLNLKSDGWLNNMVEWCRKGGGKWKLRGLLRGEKNKTSDIKSEKTAKIITMNGKITELLLSNYSANDIKEILLIYRSEYKYDEKSND